MHETYIVSYSFASSESSINDVETDFRSFILIESRITKLCSICNRAFNFKIKRENRRAIFDLRRACRNIHFTNVIRSCGFSTIEFSMKATLEFY